MDVSLRVPMYLGDDETRRMTWWMRVPSHWLVIDDAGVEVVSNTDEGKESESESE